MDSLFIVFFVIIVAINILTGGKKSRSSKSFRHSNHAGTTSPLDSDTMGGTDDRCTNPIYDHLPCNIHHDPFDDDGIGTSSSIGGFSSSLDDSTTGSGIGTGLGSGPFSDDIGGSGIGSRSSSFDD